MKKKFVIVNFLTALMVLFSILYQSLHSIEHLVVQLTEKHCEHKYTHGTTEINHSHHNPEKCLACEFTFSPYIASACFTLKFQKTQIKAEPDILSYETSAQVFKGSLFALRAPPTV